MTPIEQLLQRKHDAAMKRSREMAAHAVPGTTQVNVCSHHAKKPDPELAVLPADVFVGKFVKITLAEGPAQEHVWIFCESVRDGQIVGRIDNDLRLITRLRCGDFYHFSPELIEEYLDPDGT